MKTKKWIVADDKADAGPVPFSGPKGLLAGYDARQREIGSASGGTVTAALLKRPGKHVPAMKESKETPSDYKKPLSSAMGEPVKVRKWHKKGYL